MATRRERARRKHRVAFVLSGGGNLGAVQVGMLRALTERGIVPDIVLGCSVGALNGAAYALSPTIEGVAHLEDHWVNVGSYTLMPSSRIPNALQMVRKGTSLHSNAGLRAGLDELLGAQRRFEDLAVAFQCVAADVEEATERWFSTGEMLSPILASAALPAVFPEVTIDGRRYVDGGVIDNVPITRAVELGCREIYVMHTGPHGRPDAEIRRPLDSALQAYWIARNSRFARDLASIPEGVEAIVLPPGQRPDLRFDDFSRTADLIAQGYENSVAFLTERGAELDQRRRAGDFLRPVQRLVLSARGRNWFQDAALAANSPDGAVVTSSDDGSPSVGDDGSSERTAPPGRYCRFVSADS